MEKVLHILPMNKVSGAERMALLMCKNMKCYEPIVVCGGKDLSDVFIREGIKGYDLNFSMKRILSTISGLKKIINENDVKIVHAHDNTASLIAYLTKKSISKDIKVVSHIHNCYPFLKGNGMNKMVDKFLRNRYDANITCGKVVTDFYEENASYFKREEGLTLPNAMDIKYITNVDKDKIEEMMKKHNIPRDKKVLGFVGRLDEQKGLVPFIKELSKYKSEFEDCIFLLVGNGSLEEEITNLLNEFGLNDLFILTGFTESVSAFYPIIYIFFLPSLYEGLPMALLEAMAFKKPVVSMNVGSISEVINKENGILIESGKYDKFVKELSQFKNNEIKINKCGKEAYNTVNEKFNINNYVNKVENLYLKEV